TALMSNGETKEVTADEGTVYKSYDLNRAVVSEDGSIQVPINAPLGDVGIRVTHGGKSKTVTVTILSGPTLNSLEVTPEKIELERGKTSQIGVTALMSNGETKEVTADEGTVYKSYDLNRAVVSEDGFIDVPINAPLGDVGIRVTHGGISKIITIKVINPI
ncbi:hypothetical protein, partial [Bacillus sp. HNG]|uniref:hypothetical protein n=1 Tax=Bacillus sp. HNG TaxID=2293325 RepID=UPI0016784DB8